MQYPQWNPNKGIAMLRLGGLSPVKQKVRQIVPERYGLWAFIFPYWDWWFVSGKSSQDKFPKKEVAKHRMPHPKKFFAQGTIFTRFPVKNSVKVETESSYFFGPNLWYRTDDRDLYQYLSKKFAQDLGQCRHLVTHSMFRNERVLDLSEEEASRIKHPYLKGRGGYLSLDHFEVFIPRGTKIK